MEYTTEAIWAIQWVVIGFLQNICCGTHLLILVPFIHIFHFDRTNNANEMPPLIARVEELTDLLEYFYVFVC